MFFILLFFVFLCEFSGSSRSSWTNGANFHEKILSSLNVTELNVTTLNVLLTKLKLQNCSTGNTNQLDVGQRCVPAEYLFETHKLDKSKKVSPRELAELSTSLLYVLLPENVGATFRRFSQNGDNRTVYELFLQYYQTNGHICARLLDIILRDLKREFRDSVIKQKNCFSAVDLFKQMNLSTEDNELDREQFHIISIMIISHLLNGRCLNVTNDLHDLPCRSYFTSNLLGSDGLISFDGFKEVLESIGLGNESNHDDSEEAGDDHDHLRKRRDTSDNSGTSPPLNTPKHCYSANDLAEIFLVNKSFGVDSKEFSEICPALIQQLKSNSCVTEKNNEVKIPSKGSDNHVWLYGFVSVLIISLLSLAGIAVIPTMNGRIYKKIIIVLVGLAIGTLTGDALFHLIPHAAGFHASSHGSEDGHSEHGNEDDKAFLWKFLVVASGIYGFFLFETFTHLFLQSGGHGHSHNIEHTRKHSPFERNNSCRTVERHEMRLTSSPLPETDHTHDTTQVIFNQVSGKTEEKSCSKSKVDDHKHDDNIPNLLTDSSHGSEKKKISSVGWMIIIGDTIHNITDGIAIGAAFTQDIGGGLSTSIAVFCHELPHELGDFAVLISSGMTVKQAMLANFLSACSSFIGLVIGILIGQQTEEGNQWVFAVMGGMFLYIALVDMLPELMHSEELAGAGRLQIFLLQNIGILLGFILMLLIAYFEEDLVISW